MAKKPPHKLRFAVVAADTVVFTAVRGKLEVLLIKVDPSLYPKKYRALPGGLMHPEETAEDSAQRHVKNKGGIIPAYMEQIYTFSEVGRDPRGRVVSTAYLALLPEVRMEEAGDAEWFPVKKLPPLAYDHKEIIKCAVDRLRSKLKYTNIAFALLPKEFTIAELRELYQIILGKELDKRNFQKKIFSLGLLKPVLKKKKTGPHRPAQLYRFRSEKLQAVEIL